ncbi:MAG: ABC transporter permease, partial [Stackebrandtia sp.]
RLPQHRREIRPMNTIASEWLKIRTLRSSYILLALSVAAVLVAAGITALMIADYDSSSAAEQATFAPANVGTPAIPFVQLFVVVFAALTVTGEYATGAIRGSLMAVPRRGRLLAAKLVVVGGCGLLLGQAVSFACLGLTLWLAGDRPAPIAPWQSVSEAIMPTVSEGLVMTMLALVAVGLGAVIRSSAGTLVALTGLLFVLPSMVFFLPKPWDARIFGVMPTNLAAPLAGSPNATLSSLGAGVTMLVYVLGFATAGVLFLRRRDA